MTNEIQIAPRTYLNTQITRRINVSGIDVDEGLIKELLIKPLEGFNSKQRPKLSAAFEIYMTENTPASIVGLIQLNTGFRISEPTLARVEDLVLDHDIPHLWIK